MASLAAAEQSLMDNHQSPSSESMDSEERDLALLAQQIEEEAADRRSHGTGSSGDTQRKRSVARQMQRQQLRQVGETGALDKTGALDPSSRSDGSHSALSGMQLQGLQRTLEKGSTSSGSSFGRGRSHEELWRLLQQQRKDVEDLRAAIAAAETRQSEELEHRKSLLAKAQQSSEHIEQVVAEAYSKVGEVEEMKQNHKSELKKRLEQAKTAKIEVEDVKDEIADKIAAIQAKSQVEIEKLEMEARIVDEKNQERDMERILVDAAQRKVQEAEIEELKKKLELTKRHLKEVREERDMLRQTAKEQVEKQATVAQLQEQVAEVKGALEEKLEQVAVPDGDQFKCVFDELKEAKVREAEKLKEMAALKLQVQEIKMEKNEVIGDDGKEETAPEAAQLLEEVVWIEIKNSYHEGDNLPGSGEQYTLSQAKSHAQRYGAQCFTQDLWLEHAEGTDGVFWFHSKMSEDEKTKMKYTGQPHGTQNLFWRADNAVPTDVLKTALSQTTGPAFCTKSAKLASSSTSLATSLATLPEDEDTLSDHGSVAATCNVSSIGDGEDGVADIHDFDDEKDTVSAIPTVQSVMAQKKLSQEIQAQLDEERQEKERLRAEMAATLAEKRNRLQRLESKVEASQNYKEEQQVAIEELKQNLEEKVTKKAEAEESEQWWVEQKKREAEAKEARILELRRQITDMKEKLDKDSVEFAEIRQHIAMAKAAKQLADTRIADYMDAVKAMNAKHEDTVGALNREIAKLQEFESTAAGGSMNSRELVKESVDQSQLEELRRAVAELKKETAELTATLEQKEAENQREREVLEKKLATQEDEIQAEHEAAKKELRQQHEREMAQLRLSYEESSSSQ